MRIEQKIHEFLFHPLSKAHSSATKALAVITVVALSVLTISAFLFAFVVINAQDKLKDKKIVKKASSPTTASGIGKSILTDSLDKQRAPSSNIPAIAKNADMEKVKTVKEKHLWQLKKFESWAKQEKWEMFHHNHSHYDWWMFPVDRGSQGQGTTYAVYAPEIAYLKNDEEFMANLRRGAELVAKSWGWDITTGTPVSDPLPSQKWENWPVRLGKMADSLRLFGQNDYRSNIRKFALQKLDYHTLPDWINNALDIPVR